MIYRKLFDDLDDINEWREKEEGKDVKIINIEFVSENSVSCRVWYETKDEDKDENPNYISLPYSTDYTKTGFSRLVDIQLKNHTMIKGYYDYDKDEWIVNLQRIRKSDVQDWLYPRE